MDSSCIDETSTSSDSAPPPVKLCRVGSGASSVIDSDFGIEAESTRKLPSSKYKGVVPQPNGRWGAQIYEKHQRVWLGTFNQEVQAAVAYDTAVQRFRGRDAVTNFKPLSEGEGVELSFLNSHSKAEIVDMLRKHTYNDELEQSRRAHVGSNDRNSGFRMSKGGEREQMFEKVVTPSDVGKLNRLVIPKQQAEKHFVLRKEDVSKGVLLNFEDQGGKVWRFRYSYWNSSQSYVLTKGWSRFVKEKGLQAGDVVSFKRSGGSRSQQEHQQLYIEWKLKGRRSSSSNNNNNNNNNNNDHNNNSSTGGVDVTATQNGSSSNSTIRLFGVDIFQVELEGKKRKEGMFGLELLDNNMNSSKRQKLINVL